MIQDLSEPEAPDPFRRQPRYHHAGQEAIGRLLDRYGIPFFYRQPNLITHRGSREIWYPDFTLPTYHGLFIDYLPKDSRPAPDAQMAYRQAVYRTNGIEAVFLTEPDLVRPTWGKDLVDRLEQFYWTPVGTGYDRSPRFD